MSRNAPVYLDAAATTSLDPSVLEAMLPYLREHYGNPSSVHSAGRAARAAIDEARDAVAAALGCERSEVIFTSGGTEANNLAIRGAVERAHLADPGRLPHIVTTAIEHEAVLATCEQLSDDGRATVTIVGCDREGRVAPADVVAALSEDTAVVSVMLANNEVGTIEPVAEIAAAVHAARPGTVIHTDAVQAVGKLPVRFGELGVDLLSLSAHKFHGPKGVGALVARRGTLLRAQLTGGGQERRRRSGTENVAGIVGLGHAISRAVRSREETASRIAVLAAQLREAVLERVPDAVCTGAPEQRLPGIVSFLIPGVRSEVLVTALDREGICVSAGSACSGGAELASHVVAAMRVPAALAGGALRCSLDGAATEAEIRLAAVAIGECVARCRAAGQTALSPTDSGAGVGLSEEL